jgi:hypothetical protein
MRRYFPSTLNSDLTGGTFFNRFGTYFLAGTPTGLSFTAGAQQTTTSFVFTQPLHPGTSGTFTGDYTIPVVIATGANQVNLSMSLQRISSTGTVLTNSGATAEQTAIAGTLTFTFTNLSLGTFARTDRLRISYIFRNTTGHANIPMQVVFNDEGHFIEAPYAVRLTKFG